MEQIYEAIHRWRLVVPTARRVVAAHWDYFVQDGPGLRIGMAKGKYDAYLLMPRGKRDEEFHNAITDLLSDWTSTVPQPEVVSAKVISPTHDALTMAIRDFLDRMGMQNSLYDPARPGARRVHGGGAPRPRCRGAPLPRRVVAGPWGGAGHLGARRRALHLPADVRLGRRGRRPRS